MLIVILVLLILLIIINISSFLFNIRKLLFFFIKKTKKNLKEVGQKRQIAIQVSEAAKELSSKKIGALVTFEKNNDLSDYVALGVNIDANVDELLLKVIFNKSSLLHDGAVIIRGGKIACTSAYFPTTTKRISAKYGSRHRAALGISERSDALTIIVSETTGQISYTYKSKIVNVDNSADLFQIIYKFLADKKDKPLSTEENTQDEIKLQE